MTRNIVSFTMKLATKVGLENAAFLQDIAYWVDNNRSSNTNFVNGRYWSFSSQEELCKRHPYWTRKQVQRVIKNCKDNGWLLVGNFNHNPYDRTNWYTISSEIESLVWENGNNENGTIECPKSDNVQLPEQGNDINEEEYITKNDNNNIPIEIFEITNLSTPDNARQAQEAVRDWLQARGWLCELEYEVPNRGDGRIGRIDIMATKNNCRLGIEVDWQSPREKSIYKLMHEDCKKLILLRDDDGKTIDTLSCGITVLRLKTKTKKNTSAIPSQSETGFSDKIQSIFEDWLTYKKEEKKYIYKPIGLKNLISEIQSNVQKYGEVIVEQTIRRSISNTWQGIAWDQCQKIQREIQEQKKNERQNEIYF